jgi:hypothetical protein
MKKYLFTLQARKQHIVAVLQSTEQIYGAVWNLPAGEFMSRLGIAFTSDKILKKNYKFEIKNHYILRFKLFN